MIIIVDSIHSFFTCRLDLVIIVCIYHHNNTGFMMWKSQD